MSRPQPPNPSGGAGYQKVQLVTNAFEITTLPRKTYYQYDVSFIPAVPIRNKKIQLMHHLQTIVAPQFFNPRLVYDGSAIAYSPRQLLLANNGNGKYYVKLGVSTPVPPGTKGSYEIILTSTMGTEIQPNHVDDLIRGKTMSPRSLVATNLIQLVIRQGPNQNYANNGRAYFVHTPNNQNENRRIDRSGLELWRGIFQSVRPTIGRMILTIDTCTAAVYQSGAMIDICMNMIGGRNVSDLDLDPSKANFKKLEAFFKRLRIKVETGGGRSRIKTIHGLVQRAGEFTFLKDDFETTVARHFLEAHGIKVQFPRIIGVRLSGKNAPNQDVVPLELCHIEPGQLFKRKLPEDLTTDMVRFATMRPDERRRRIEAGVRSYRNSEFVVESGMLVNTQPITIDAKLLNVPTLYFNPQAPALRVEKGAWNAVRQRFTQPRPLSDWAVVNFTGRFDQGAVMNMMQDLAKSCTNLGMTTAAPYGYVTGNLHNPEGSLNTLMQNIAQARGGQIPEENLRKLIIIVLLPQNAAHTRNAVKFWGDIRHGIATQCLREQKLQRANDQYWNNIALKLNVRLGGTNFYSLSPIITELRTAPFMIMGADVGHPGPGVQKPSVTSIVYSHDEYATQYVALTGIQPPRIEQILNLKAYVMSALDSFGAKNKASPKRLIFFRDGLSEGEYQGVAAKEIQEIQDGFKELWEKRGVKPPFPLLTFIVVGKRHHAVFFPKDQHGADKTGNCHPGSLIDSGITHPAVTDFYLQSHAAIQGTCRSSHYILLHDDNRYDLAKIQQLAYTLCHVYAKATRSVSIPAPVYYADLVCSRGLFHVNPEANLFFDDTVSSLSGSSNNTLDLDRWRSAFLPINPRLEKSMYFL